LVGCEGRTRTFWCGFGIVDRADFLMYSIREFCDLQTPIFMFDKDGAFVVMKLEQVGHSMYPDIVRQS
jgi:hypothetical protein